MNAWDKTLKLDAKVNPGAIVPAVSAPAELFKVGIAGGILGEGDPAWDGLN